MVKYYSKLIRIGKKKINFPKKQRLSFFAALFISIFLAAAAYGKFFHPVEKLKQLEVWTSYFEIILIFFLFIFHRRSAMWLAAAIIFASWGGYATYWFRLKLPCNCLGSVVSLPSGYALSLDILFIVLSCCMAFLLGAGRGVIYFITLVIFLFSFIGYIFGEWAFYKTLGMMWNLL